MRPATVGKPMNVVKKIQSPAVGGDVGSSAASGMIDGHRDAGPEHPAAGVTGA